MRRSAAWLAAGLMLALPLGAWGCGGEDEGSGEAFTIQLGEQSGSGQSGTATLTPEGDMTRVTIELGNPPDEPQPAHIHRGTCAELDPTPAFPLEDVVDGQSESTEPVTIEELQSESFSINVHKSGAEAEVYVACGEISTVPGGGTTETDTVETETGGRRDY